MKSLDLSGLFLLGWFLKLYCYFSAMKNCLSLLVIACALFGCVGKKSAGNTDTSAMIHKLWQFKYLDTAVMARMYRRSKIQNNTLDLTGKDTLRFKYETSKNITTFRYKLKHDVIYVQDKPSFRVLRLNDDTLKLCPLFESQNGQINPKDSSVVMVYTLNK